MAEYVVTQEHEKCIACQACVTVDSENWYMGSDNKAHFKKNKISTPKEIKANKAAEASCPVAIIHVKLAKKGVNK